eukprot:CAMPEP_0114166644 /NCGR_PEP_ID=MMETSP0043_2-20121206/31949_1 /TAXON_ID=464988 /ORGANISM="Hemiselmis andersenii, Strain CCMP644" /LENGTH=34 /DNA_ID= /DNA_START= /DNA_END= /DNA_ORIENTATION=
MPGRVESNGGGVDVTIGAGVIPSALMLGVCAAAM